MPDTPSAESNESGATEHDPTVVYQPESATPSPATEPPVKGAFRYGLVVQRGPRAGFTYVLGVGETSAGRDPESGIFLDDITVSRHHARFIVDDSGLTVEDLGSTNGTYVNMQRRDRTGLTPPDEVIIGKFHLVVVQGDIGP